MNMKTINEVIIYIDAFLEFDKPGRIFNDFQRGYITAFRDLRGAIIDEEEQEQ